MGNKGRLLNILVAIYLSAASIFGTYAIFSILGGISMNSVTEFNIFAKITVFLFPVVVIFSIAGIIFSIKNAVEKKTNKSIYWGISFLVFSICWLVAYCLSLLIINTINTWVILTTITMAGIPLIILTGIIFYIKGSIFEKNKIEFSKIK